MINTSFNIPAKENHFCGMIQVDFISSALIITMHLLRGKALKNRDTEAVPKVSECHPELVSGSHIPLILLDAEPSSA
jgi:hypothetical protein